MLYDNYLLCFCLYVTYITIYSLLSVCINYFIFSIYPLVVLWLHANLFPRVLPDIVVWLWSLPPAWILGPGEGIEWCVLLTTCGVLVYKLYMVVCL